MIEDSFSFIQDNYMPHEGWTGGNDSVRMRNDPSFEPWRILGMGSGSTHVLRLTASASSLGVLG